MTLIVFILLFLSGLALSQSNLEVCQSVNASKIPHYDFSARESGLKKRILVFVGIHGDEPEAHELGQLWLKRLEKIKTPSNFWRIIPLLNPDGARLKTRTNANGIDVNRNFPTKDWDQLAVAQWHKTQKSNPRRFPGKIAGSEPETKCAMAHIDDFRPDLVVSIHTPYGLFDFDGPAEKRIPNQLLPWKRLGTFPGSLGRYLWDERQTPTLTIELRPDSLRKHSKSFILFQDRLTELL